MEEKQKETRNSFTLHYSVYLHKEEHACMHTHIHTHIFCFASGDIHVGSKIDVLTKFSPKSLYILSLFLLIFNLGLSRNYPDLYALVFFFKGTRRILFPSFFYCFIMHMCIQGLGHFSPLLPPPP
jgi:hypothetical protein